LMGSRCMAVDRRTVKQFAPEASELESPDPRCR
jgi:hypothetical protein